MCYMFGSIKMSSFAVGLMIKGYLKYKNIWENPSGDNQLSCECEIGNVHNTHAVEILLKR